MKQKEDWSKKKLDAKYLADSGLLFEINRSVLHVVGVSLAFDQNGNVVLKDHRAEPEKAVLDPGVYQLGLDKLTSFLREYGDNQMERRQNKLGWAYQQARTTKGALPK